MFVSVIYNLKKYILENLKIMKSSQIRPSVVSYLSLKYITLSTNEMLKDVCKKS